MRYPKEKPKIDFAEKIAEFQARYPELHHELLERIRIKPQREEYSSRQGRTGQQR